jgi:hypothetical protein
MESSLHRELKARYGGEGGACEVTRGPYRADAVAPDGAWIEVQSGPLGPLRPKLRALLPAQAVRVVKPVPVARSIVRRGRGAAADDARPRKSPWRGTIGDVFDDLVGLAAVFPHPNLTLDVLAVEVEEHRVPRRRRPGYAVADRRLVAVRERVTLRGAADLWRLLPGVPEDCGGFTTADLAAWLDRPRAHAQRVAYCLRLTGAAVVVGKRGHGLLYRRAEPVAGEAPARPPRRARRPAPDAVFPPG